MNKVPNILFRNFNIFSHLEKNISNFKSLIFQLALNGKLDFYKLSEGRIKKSLQALVKEQKQYLKKARIAFQEDSDSVWPMVMLGDIAQIISGQSPKGKFYNENKQGTPFYQGKKEFGEIYLGEPVKWTVSVTKTANPNDILMSVRAPVGPVNITLQKICIGRGLASIRGKNIINQMFLFYYLRKNQDKIKGSGGSVFDSINQKSIKQIKIPLPPLSVQKEIISLMEKCTLLESQVKKKYKKQEEFSQSITHFISHSKNKTELSHHWKILKNNFKEVLYSKTGVKKVQSMIFQLALNGKLDFQKLSEGRIKKPLQTLIKEQKQYLKKTGIAFKEESDNVWPMVRLRDVSTVGSGNSAPQNKKLFNNGQWPFCRTSDVGKVHISDDFKEIHDFLNREGIKGLKLFKKNTILIPKSGASTFLNHRVLLGIDSYVSSHLATVYANQKIIIPKLLFNLLCLIDTRTLTSEQNYPSLKLSQIKGIKIPLPPLSVQKEIVALMEKCVTLEVQIKKEKSLNRELSLSQSEKINLSNRI